MTKQTQYDAIWLHLYTHGSATIAQLIKASGSNWPHKRLAEMTDAEGFFFAAPRYRLLRDSVEHKGRKVRVYRLQFCPPKPRHTSLRRSVF